MKFKKMMYTLLILVLLSLIGGILYMYHPRFGTEATGKRLANMESKPKYKDGAFDNLEYTPALAEGVTYTDILKSFFFEKKIRVTPIDTLPVIKSDLHNLPADSNLYVWFGHSSYLLQLDHKKILIDPVFSKYATPVRVSVKAFDMSYEYTAQDIPEIDIMVITHDHWDHLDYNTFQEIKHKVKHIVTGLGVGAHLEKWGYPSAQITELYWGESANIAGFEFTAATARHFAGRTFKRNVTLWSSFILQAQNLKLFLGGDSGYGKHFKEIGEKYGPFDYAILENGQYNEKWINIHMLPEEVVKATKELNSKHLIPVHSSKFPLAVHPWDEPLIRVTKEAEKENIAIVTPQMGEIVSLDTYQKYPHWWIGLN
ncbi:MBL fold metallo-hydrolase [Sphingobacterium rhinopitheci]|uniref:MBL fold metallo-hydrolase n=1 Tax=Sphingobacterium rhinopitheci TaxID=2781960 RepID=UPI001F5202A9|nr:MBL fold metallo-hydrolase [Sphingobacterium rhinopitheci]